MESFRSDVVRGSEWRALRQAWSAGSATLSRRASRAEADRLRHEQEIGQGYFSLRRSCGRNEQQRSEDFQSTLMI